MEREEKIKAEIQRLKRKANSYLACAILLGAVSMLPMFFFRFLKDPYIVMTSVASAILILVAACYAIAIIPIGNRIQQLEDRINPDPFL